MKTSKKLLAFLLAVIMTIGVFAVAASAAAAVKISACTFTYSKEAYYTGKAITPSVKLAYQNKTLKKGTDYTVSYSDNVKIGTGKIVVTGKGSYTGTKKLSFKIELAAPKNIKASEIKATSAKLSWSKVTGASKYAVFSYNASTKKYAKLTTVKTNSAIVSSLSAAKAYKLCVRAYNKDGKYSAVSGIITVNTLPGTPKLTVSTVSTTELKLSWTKAAGAAGYKVYSYSDSTKKFTVVKSVSGASNLKLSKTGLKAGTTYAFAVAAYYKTGGNTIIGAKSAIVYAGTKPAKVTGLKASSGSKTVSLSWTSVSGATGYNIYSYNASSKTYTKLGSSSANSYSINGLKPGTTYRYAVEAYKTVSGKKSVGAKSAVLAVTTQTSNEFYDFRDMINSRKFTVNYKMTADGTTVTAKTVVSGKIAASTMKTTLEGVSATMKTWYDGNKKTGIVRAKMMGLGFYDTFGEKEAIENALDADTMVNLFAPKIAAGETVKTGKATIDSKACNYYSFKAEGGTVVTYYFNNSKLIRISASGENIIITGYSASASSSDISKPSTLGYVQMKDMLF